MAYKDLIVADLQNDPRVAEVVDLGVGADDHTPYPDIGLTAAERVAAGDADRAVLVCGTGIGMAVSANKVPGVRATTAHDSYSAERSVLSNDCQVLTLGAACHRRRAGPAAGRRVARLRVRPGRRRPTTRSPASPLRADGQPPGHT